MQEAEKKEREKRREKERREAEAAKRLKAAGDAAARRRDKAAHTDAVANFRTLLQVLPADDMFLLLQPLCSVVAYCLDPVLGLPSMCTRAVPRCSCLPLVPVGASICKRSAAV